MALRVGIAGMGHMGRLYFDILRRWRSTVNLVAVADPVKDNLGPAEGSGVSVFPGYEEMLSSERLDAVVLALPNHLREDSVGVAAEHGVDVFVDKPLARSLEEARRILEVCGDSGVRLTTGVNYRYLESVRRVKREVEGGVLGRIHLASFRLIMGDPRFRGDGGSGSWWSDPGMAGGGCLIDLGYHLLDLARWILGPQELSHAEVDVDEDGELDVAASVITRNRDGVRVVINVGWFNPNWFPDFDFELSFHGEERSVSSSAFEPSSLLLHAAKEGLKNVVRRAVGREIDVLSYTYYYWSYARILADWLSCTRSGLGVPVSLEEQLDVVALVDEAYSSARRRSVRRKAPEVPPERKAVMSDRMMYLMNTYAALSGDVLPRDLPG